MNSLKSSEKQPPRIHQWVVTCAPALLLGATLVWLFFEVLFQGRILTFRDSAQFFQHLFQFVQDEWNAGRVPLWNPYVNCGVPAVANATSSVFYPLKLIFFLPLPFAWNYNGYILCHVMLAGGFVYGTARRWDVSRCGATVAALSYAFCGNVLYQYSNLIFLVGAAWLPAALWAADRIVRQRSIGAALTLGVVLALTVLGGDPQMAYNAGLLAALYVLFVRPPGNETEDSSNDASRSRWIARCRWPAALLSVAAVSAFALSAVQVLPTLEWSQQSGRHQWTVPRSLYEFPSYWSRDETAATNAKPPWHDGLTGKQDGLNTPEARYLYSVPPWRAAEYIWPWFSGASHSRNQRWIFQLSQQPSWVPSLYMGLLPLLLAIAAWRVRRTDARTRWLSLVVAGSFIASFGKFGLGWLINRVVASGDGAVGGETIVGDAFGGLYWLLTVVLPGYVQFRWPGKLLVVTAIGLSLLAGFGWDRSFREKSRRLEIGLVLVIALSLIGGLTVLSLWPWWQTWLKDFPGSAILGPFNTRGAYHDLLYSMFYTLAVAVGYSALWVVARKQKIWKPACQLALLGMVALDLAIANKWMIASIPISQFEQPSQTAALIARAEQADGASSTSEPQLFRVHRIPIESPRWKDVSSADRFTELNDFGRHSLQPMHHLPDRLEFAEFEEDTFRNIDHELLLYSPPVFADDGSVAHFAAPRRALDALNVKYFIVPNPDAANSSVAGLRRKWAAKSGPPPLIPEGDPLDSLSKSTGELVPGVQVLLNSGHLPRCWIVYDVNFVPPLSENDLTARQQFSRALVFPERYELDFRQGAVVESEQFAGLRMESSRAVDSESCQIVDYQPQRVEVAVRLTESGLLILSDLYEKNWIVDDIAGGRPRRLPILRTNRIMRGVRLEPGEHRLVFRYVPRRFYWGAGISAIAWLAFGSLLLLAWFRRRGNRGQSS